MLATLMGLKSISARDLSDLLPSRRVLIVDVNAPARWAAAHVPGARNLDPVQFNSSDLPAELDRPLVFYCSNFMCRKAPLAARRAKAMGYTDVRVMSAGIQGWLGDGLPVEAGGVGAAE
jgi:rhodanese-related sulfurtransferase